MLRMLLLGGVCNSILLLEIHWRCIVWWHVGHSRGWCTLQTDRMTHWLDKQLAVRLRKPYPGHAKSAA